MWLRNLSKRLITVNGPMTESGYSEFYDILPGENPAAEVPDTLCSSDFVKNLIKIGDLIQVTAPVSDEPDIGALSDEAMLLGIKVDKKWDAARIQAEIDKAHA